MAFSIAAMSERLKGYWTYVLYSDVADRFYIGVSEHVEQRLAKHNSGGSRWTARHVPWRCVFARKFPDLTEARKFENRLKRQRRGDGFFRLTGLCRDDFGLRQGS